MKKDAFTIAPGSERKVFADVEKDLGKSLVLSVAYQQPVGYTVSGPDVQVGAKGSLTEILKKKKKTAPVPNDL